MTKIGIFSFFLIKITTKDDYRLNVVLILYYNLIEIYITLFIIIYRLLKVCIYIYIYSFTSTIKKTKYKY